jgi:hypothetical protein
MRVVSVFLALGVFAGGFDVVAGVVAQQCSCSPSDASTWKCGQNLYVCPGTVEVCSQSMTSDVTVIKLTEAQCEDMQTKDLDDDCPEHSISHFVCYGESGDSCKYDGSYETCNGNVPIEPVPSEVVEECPQTVFDFSGLTNGQYIRDEFWESSCVRVTAFANTSGGDRKGFTPLTEFM